jgi:hypothetical protein
MTSPFASLLITLAAGLPAPETTLSTHPAITQQDVREFFKHSDQLYNQSKLDGYMAQYEQNYVVSYQGKPIPEGRQAREGQLYRLFVQQYPHLSETQVHSIAIADNGQSAVADVTITERFRLPIGEVRNALQVVDRQVFHNFAIIDQESVKLALFNGEIKIVSAEVWSHNQSENAGK